MSSIREQIIQAVTIKLADILVSNGYQTNIGAYVERARSIFAPQELPAISVIPKPESALQIYGKVSCTMPLTIEGTTIDTQNPSIVAEKILADLIACLTEFEQTLIFTSGGTYQVVAGNVITGATSGATARVVAITLTSGTWANGDAAGNFRLRLQAGTFQAENLNVGTNLNVATIAGDSILATRLNGLGDIIYTGGGPETYPNSGDQVIGCPANFVIKYNTLIGNPNAQ